MSSLWSWSVVVAVVSSLFFKVLVLHIFDILARYPWFLVLLMTERYFP